ncbi:MAG: hypothetical protein ACRDRM_05125 [Pseudonocardiaceae bacterium]
MPACPVQRQATDTGRPNRIDSASAATAASAASFGGRSDFTQ